jgi:serine/threonine-protein kinase haspin
MDHPVHGVKATVIDLGLARMDAQADNGSTEVHWTPFDKEIFEGEGGCTVMDSLAIYSFNY